MAGFSFGELARSGLTARPGMGRRPYGSTGVGTDMYANGYGTNAPATPRATTWGGYPQSGATPPIGYPQANTTVPSVSTPDPMPSTMGGYGSNSHGTYSADPFNGAYGSAYTGGNMSNPTNSNPNVPDKINGDPATLLGPGATPEQIASLKAQQGSMQRFDAFRNTMLNAFGTLGDESTPPGDVWASHWTGSSSDYMALKDAYKRYVAGGGDRFAPLDPQALQYITLNAYFENQRRAGRMPPEWWTAETQQYNQQQPTPGAAPMPVGAPGPRRNTNI